MLYETYLVELMFTLPEITRLETAHEDGIRQYWEVLDIDPYPLNYVDEYVGDVVKDILKGRGIDIQEKDVIYLVNTIKYYLL
jgi:hypothetical protein